MKKIIILLGFSFLVATAAFASPKAAAKQLAKELTANLTASNLDLTIRSMKLEGTNESSSFANNFLLDLEAELSENEEDYASVRLQPQATTRGFGDFEDEEAEDEKEQVATLQASYRIKGDKVFVDARIEGDEATFAKTVTVSFKKSSLPKNWALRPQNRVMVAKEQKLLPPVMKKNAFAIKLEINHGDGGVYQEGDILEIYFTTKKACFPRVLYRDADGNKILLFPQRWDDGAAVKAGTTHSLHGNTEFTIGAPYGMEMLYAVCSTQKIPEAGMVELSEEFMGFDPNEPITETVNKLRGIGFKRKKQEIAETRVFLTTVPK